MSLTDPLTIDDFERLPDALALNHEILDGELIDVGGHPYSHNSLRDHVMCTLRRYAEDRRLGMVISGQAYDFGGDTLAPDVSFFQNEKIPLVQWHRRVQPFVPDLAIEIVSPNDTFAQLTQKVNRYRKNGTQEVWIFDIDFRRAFLFSDRGDAILNENQQFASPLLPGLSVPIADVFDRR